MSWKSYSFLLLLLLGWGQVASALTVEAEGQALITQGDKRLARELAIRDASQLALLQAGSWFSSTQQMQNGVLQLETLRMSSEGRIEDVQVLREQVQGDVLKVWIRAEVAPAPQCAQAGTSNYRKQVAITAFPLNQPDHATLGHLDNIVSGLSLELARRLQNSKGLELRPNGQLLVLPPPYANKDPADISAVVPRLHQMGIHYVVSGRILDMSLSQAGVNEDRLFVTDALRRVLPKHPDHQRFFALEVYVHDALSGQLLYQDQFSTSGYWLKDHHLKTGFATDAFWSSDYGNQVQKLLNKISNRLDDTLSCQPFSARIVRTEGRRLLVAAGSRAGLRTGDTLVVYRQRYDYGPSGERYSQLEDTQTAARVSQVQGDSAWLELPVEAISINIQQDDRVMAW
ncbi:flagellar assembly protein T N-terminal domain-containing protein [Balneatrix alpica]|uniref:flagellar assembly protein T N-terminal domain-containing protein n=1 Tax=Balneatrix alpica TaxID=75684 RepID=UPI0027397AFF|nr:flagellar assembly protein T N-terminal domain-containing protein [Balneatrix alpica]